MRITVLAGGVGAARFLRGLKAAAPDAEITVIGNTGDDISLFGLHVSPDLDTVMYTLGGGIDEEQGWGRAGDTYTVLAELTAYGAGPDWFGLGDRDIATHLHRTSMLGAGLPLSAATGMLCQRWQPGVRLLPMTDDTVAGADVVLFPPSNPVVSVGTILAVPGIADAVRAKTVVGVSPIIGGAPVRGMADKCLAAIGVETSAVGVGAHYGAALLAGWLVDERDKAAVDAPELAGIAVRAIPLYMTDLPAAAAIARAALDLAQELTP